MPKDPRGLFLDISENRNAIPKWSFAFCQISVYSVSLLHAMIDFFFWFRYSIPAWLWALKGWKSIELPSIYWSSTRGALRDLICWWMLMFRLKREIEYSISLKWGQFVRLLLFLIGFLMTRLLMRFSEGRKFW